MVPEFLEMVTSQQSEHMPGLCAACRGAIQSFEAAETEYELVFKVIQHMYRKEGLLTVTGAPKKQPSEDDSSFRNRLWKERRLALSPNFVPE